MRFERMDPQAPLPGVDARCVSKAAWQAAAGTDRQAGVLAVD